MDTERLASPKIKRRLTYSQKTNDSFTLRERPETAKIARTEEDDLSRVSFILALEERYNKTRIGGEDGIPT